MALLPALVAESARKSRVCWLTYGDVVERLVWHAWYDDAVVVVSGDTGQVLPGLAAGGRVDVTMRSKDTGGLLVRWPGTATVVAPTDESWDAHAAALLAVRLNLPDPAAAVARWRDTATIVRLTPVGEDGNRESGPLP